MVTKFFPASDVRLLAELGVTDIGENRHQEAEAKAAECSDLDLRWHFVGGLQSNKAAAVASYADVVESVDRRKLVRRLNEGAHGRSHPVDCLVQVSLDDPDSEGRSGAAPDDVPALAEEIEAAGMLRLRGLMAVAPLGVDPRGPYQRLSAIHAEFVASRPEATWLSAGMSADLEEAVTGRRDTRAHRHRDPRIAATGQVVSKTHISATGRRSSGGRSHERRDAQDR